MNLTVTYIHHSGYLIESAHALFLFDFVEGTLPPLALDKKLFVFVSHRHQDHFSPDIFELAHSHADTVFVLSSDIRPNKVPESAKKKTFFMKPHKVLEFPQEGTDADSFALRVTTFKSTDEGVAFVLELRDASCISHSFPDHEGNFSSVVYHAGDLNDWRWNGEPLSWNNNMSTNYKRELKKIHDAGFYPDIAMLPLDGRQDDLFYLGIDEFMDIVGAKKIFPMHFWGDFSVISRMKALDCSAGYQERIVDLEADGQTISFENS